MWLKVSPTNHNPKVIARFYLETVEEVAGTLNLYIYNMALVYTVCND